MSTPISHELPLLLSTLPPSKSQRRSAYAIVGGFLAVFLCTIPLAFAPLPRLNDWLPFFATALFITDLITCALLLSQFAIVRKPAFLVLAMGYLFSSLMVVSYILTFPRLFAPTGLLGADLQTAVWCYVAWHVASPLSVLLYELFKDAEVPVNLINRSLTSIIATSVGIIVALVCLLTWLFIAYHDYLPRIYADAVTLSSLSPAICAGIALLGTLVLALLWRRGRSVLDLWLMVTVTAWLIEIILNGVLMTDRFSLGWYVGRLFSLIAGSVVLLVLLAETTTLYAHLARSAMRQRASRQTRQMAMDTMAASIVHEVSQPLAAIGVNAESARLLLSRSPPDIREAQAALEDIAADGARGKQVLENLRAVFKKRAPNSERFDMSALVHEVLGLLEMELRAGEVRVTANLSGDLEEIVADRGQIQQVLLNVISNAIDAMRSVSGRARLLRIASRAVPGIAQAIVTVEDSGIGIAEHHRQRIFEPFFTTKATGTGLGLTICQSIIESHGGGLRAFANRPHGTVFEVVLPMTPAGVLAGARSLDQNTRPA